MSGVLRVGIDVGSTTVKAVALGPGEIQPVRASYLRHHGDLVDAVREAILDLTAVTDRLRVVLTGSGAPMLARRMGAPMVHEVAAVATAVQQRHPSARTVIELGGQDAKLVVLDEGHVQTNMNDRCAAGTGVTIDRCLARLGIDAAVAAEIEFDARRVQPLSSKCGVFAETDLVALARRGVPADDLVCSLADAIVLSNVAVLARGLSLLPEVLLLGGPHVHLPALAGAWRHRLQKQWGQEGTILVPHGALCFPALGACDLADEEEAPILARDRWLEALGTRRAPAGGRVREDRPLAATLRLAGKILLAHGRSAEEPAEFVGPRPPGLLVGIDVGSTRSKAIVLDESAAMRVSVSRASGDPVGDARRLLADVDAALGGAPVVGIGVTGWGAALVAPLVGADAEVLETVAHAQAARAWFPEAEVVCDVGGQDIKILALDGAGAIRDFRLSSQCNAGIGMAIESTARELGIPLEECGKRALTARRAPYFGDGCMVFLDADRVTFQRYGYKREEILAGVVQALPRVIWRQIMNGIPPSSLGKSFVLTGGVQRNPAAVHAQVEHLMQEVPGARVWVHPHAAEAGAIGAALAVLARPLREPRRLPVDSALATEVRIRSDATTRCTLCPSACPRSLVELIPLRGERRVFVAGFACPEGSHPLRTSRHAAHVRRTKRRDAPNLLFEETRLLFGRVGDRPPLCAPPNSLRIGIPRTLSMYRAGPFFRGYLEALGVAPHNVMFSPPTSDPLWRSGAGHNATDPCFPVKVTLAHVAHLLRVHDGGRPLDAILAPSLTHAMTPVLHADCASCPVVAASPALVRAAFSDSLSHRGIRLIDGPVTLTDEALVREQMFAALGGVLGIVRSQSDAAVRHGVRAMRFCDRELQKKARAVLASIDAGERRSAVLLLGRPYHADPGINHQVGEELQALGLPVLTIRSLPRDAAWLARLFAPDLAAGRIADPFDVRDLLPESANSGANERLWAARIAARHGRLAVIDLSSFKCAQDAPTAAPIRRLLDEAGVISCALHDLDETRPTSSLRLRLRTFAHALREHGLCAGPLREAQGGSQ